MEVTLNPLGQVLVCNVEDGEDQATLEMETGVKLCHLQDSLYVEDAISPVNMTVSQVVDILSDLLNQQGCLHKSMTPTNTVDTPVGLAANCPLRYQNVVYVGFFCKRLQDAIDAHGALCQMGIQAVVDVKSSVCSVWALPPVVNTALY